MDTNKIYPIFCLETKRYHFAYPTQYVSEEQRIYNYRHSRARRVIENAFGISSVRWRIFQTLIRGAVNNVEQYTLACLALHDYVRLTESAYYSPGFVDIEDNDGNIIPCEWRQQRTTEGQYGGLRELRLVRGSRARNGAVLTRDHLNDYLNSDEGRSRVCGSVPWQLRHVRRTSHCAVKMRKGSEQ